eukprot:CAMPEP_0168621708 /NCGR_PEP_ID=MMETSP0449_2-20121227/7851_1 /TAXON_ID=1082188 /ORGANISM="Strombidium rassoulzadegani, Strain ras09" /LENGTH=155 /DNA_ID=CAMNT_0008662871 /DNA_START=688 /DNA_END=1155 /DNA_ORIENTATION=-
MNTSSTGEDPEAVLEHEFVFDEVVEELGSHVEELPALLADVGSRAARPHFVVRVHVDIKDHLLLQRHEHLVVDFFGGGLVEDGSDIDLVRHSGHKSALELLCSLEAEVAAVDVVGKSKGKLSVVEVVGEDLLVVDRVQSVLVSPLELAVRKPLKE